MWILPETKLPEIINFDEVYAFKSEKSKYVCVLLDFKKQIPVDVLPNRKKEYLLNYFQKIPLEERKKVKYACSDMYEVYRDVVHKVFPEAKHLLDYFHLSQDFHKKMNEVRIKVMKGYKDDKASDEYYLLKKFNWLLFKNPEDEDKYGRLFDVERERKYNSHFKSYMNYYDLRKKILEINNDLTICYSLKLELVDFYSKSTIDNAQVNLEHLIRSFIDTNIEEMIKFSNNLINWKQEIINSFTIVGTEYKVEADKGQVVVCNKKVNNAIIENRNKIIKCIKNNANGYTNWSRFRNRVMYVLDSNATFSLETKGEIIMDAQDIIELIEYFRNLQNNEMKFEIEELRGYIDIRFEELYDKLTGNTLIPIIQIQITHYKKEQRFHNISAPSYNPLTLIGFSNPTIFEANF